MGGSRLPYADRIAAGHELADHVADRLDREWKADQWDLLVLGLPRGGVVVATAVAERLDVELEVLCVRKLGVPGHPELAFGAIAADGTQVRDLGLLASVGASNAEIDAVVQRETVELRRREVAYRGARPPLDLHERDLVIVDDGLATGATARAACLAARAAGAARVALAVPVAPRDAVDDLAKVADLVVCPRTPRRFGAVSRWYADFAEVTDDEVRALLPA